MSSLMERFMEKVEPVTESGCWIWMAATRPDFPYGVIRIDGSTRRAHRVSWELHNGEIPDGLNVLHKCDVPQCVNPNHLFIGTQSDNVNDAQRKGRHKGNKGTSGWTKPNQQGIKHFRAKLNDELVRMIRSCHGTPGFETDQKIADRIGVFRSTVTMVRLRKTWKHVI